MNFPFPLWQYRAPLSAKKLQYYFPTTKQKTHAALKQTSTIITSQINDESDCLYSSFHLISRGFHHSLSLPVCCSHPPALYQTRFQQYGLTEERGKQCRSPFPSALANDGAPPGLEQNCVREIYTHNTPGAAVLHLASKTPSLHHFLYDSWQSR